MSADFIDVSLSSRVSSDIISPGPVNNSSRIMFRNKKSTENSTLQDNTDNPSDKRVKIVDIQRLIKLKSGQVVKLDQ